MWKYLALMCLFWALDPSIQDETVHESVVLGMLLKNYDINDAPRGKIHRDQIADGPTIVRVNFYLRSLQNVDSTMEENIMELTFRQQWNDPRLAYNHSSIKYLSIREHKRIWIPDVFFSNSKSGFLHELMEPNILMRIYQNGDVLYSCRVSLVTRCDTDWRYYPFSQVICPLIIASYGYTTDHLVLLWKESDPVQISKKVTNNQRALYLTRFLTDYCTSRTNTGEYSCLKANFTFNLRFGPFFATLFLPALISVFLAWLTFWVDRKSGKSLRLNILGFSLCLSLFAWLLTLYQSPVSYIVNASHIWSGICFLFTLAALLQLFFSSVATCCQKEKTLNTGPMIMMEGGPIHNEILKPMIKDEEEEKNEKSSTSKPVRFSTDHMRILVPKRNRADRIARIAYPSVYLLFNIIFWAVYNEKIEV